MKAFRIAAFACVLLLYAVAAFGAPRAFVVAPFQITGPAGNQYLEKAIPSTLSSRLQWKGQVEALDKGAPSKALNSGADAKKALDASKANYIVWGKAVIVGEECNLDVQVLDRDGKEWSKSGKCPVKNLMGAVQGIADGIGVEVFGRPAQQAAPQQGLPVVNQMNPDIVVNQTGQQQVYMNPQFRYQGAAGGESSRMRTQTLPFAMVDFLVGSFSAKGKNEVAVISDHRLHLYTWEHGRLKLLAETVVSMSNTNFSLRAMDLNRSGTLELVVSAFMPESSSEQSGSRPSSYIYSFEGGRLRPFCDRVPYFLSVVRMPPHFLPMLVGQDWDSMTLFSPGVREMLKSGSKYALGGRLNLPKDANVFNFTWLPGGRSGEGDKLVVLGMDERLKVFSSKGEEQYKSMEKFSGTSTGIEYVKGVYGMGRGNPLLSDKYFAPMRMIAADLKRTGEYVLLVNRPISTAAQYFENYRFFPEGEIHGLFWDGLGLALQWKTRRIKGSVVNLDIGDIMNNGVQSLVVGINTHSGITSGLSKRQSFLVVYPLDVSRMDPNTPADKSEFEESRP
ncbi:MAG: VCBS repeat-containing protein [Deltaproteobacteria bacterium]|nr:VCBS repeat-containing protein [Deltaproteobacteria bacterium]